jgi:anhydro-N-acetylmuramic acid kinase
MSKIFTSLGLMSGTSLDGIDVALIRSDGETVVERGPSATYVYDQKQQGILRQALADALEITERGQRLGHLFETEELLTKWHASAVQQFLDKNSLTYSNIDVIGFHGQTVIHKPEQHLTVQLGDGQSLVNATKIQVVYDMRAADVAAGGQGAPLVPAYHRALAQETPVAFVNVGGVGNVTHIAPDGHLNAFDTGPGNALINDWMKKHGGMDFDDSGKTAARGKISVPHLKAALASEYFAKRPPKSLDRNSFAHLDFSGLNLDDGAATLTAFTAHSIARAAHWFHEQPLAWVICGGGRHNETLMQMLREILPNVHSAEERGLNGDSMEAEAWAYLAVRSLRGLPITFPGTTGVKHEMTGGVLAKPA